MPDDIDILLSPDAGQIMDGQFVPAAVTGPSSRWNALIDFLYLHRGRWIRWMLNDDVDKKEIARIEHAIRSTAVARNLELSYRWIPPYFYLKGDPIERREA